MLQQKGAASLDPAHPFRGCIPPGTTSQLPYRAFQEPFILNNELNDSRRAITTLQPGSRVACGAAPNIQAGSAYSRTRNAGCSVSHEKAGGNFLLTPYVIHRLGQTGPTPRGSSGNGITGRELKEAGTKKRNCLGGYEVYPNLTRTETMGTRMAKSVTN